MSKKIIILFLAIIFPQLSLAAFGGPPPVTGIIGGVTVNPIYNAILSLADTLLIFLIAISIIGVVIAGYLFVISTGDSGKVASARNLLIYSLVGTLTGILAMGFVNWTIGGFTGSINAPSTYGGWSLYGALIILANTFADFLYVAGTIGIVITGFMFVYSAGDSGKVASARQWLIYSLVGVLVGGSANLFVVWVTYGFSGGIGPILLTSLGRLADWFFSFLLVTSVVGVVISGYMFVTSGGDSGKVASARNLLIYSLVGTFVGAVSAILVNWARYGF